ncbi:MAG: hypothetical protein M1381_00935 [Deltaproteobacteria bacterium]|nr:hypothetical protein [Deltaproteobacteria bacterium]MCL5792191.1 hypothetical protein [Deltaproteobacteria bacterium]
MKHVNLLKNTTLLLSLLLFISLTRTVYGNDTIKLSSPPLSPKALAGLTITDINNLEAGEIVILKQDSKSENRNKSLIKASLVINKPIEKVWRLIKCTECQAQYIPDLEESNLVNSYKNGNTVAFTVKALFFTIRYRVNHYFQDNDYRLTWKLDKSYKHDIKDLYGYWQFYKIDDDHTLARYGSKLDVGSFVPEFVENYLTRKDLPKALHAVKKWIESDGKYRK